MGVSAALTAGALPAVTVAAVAKQRTSAARLGDRPLRLGSRGADVRELQTLLRQAGFKTKVDGEFGAGTRRAVQRFQRAARLDASGTAGRKTVRALRSVTTNAGAAQQPVGGFDSVKGQPRNRHLGDRIPLRSGMSGHDVRVLQDFLKRAGFRTSIDGEFGRSTLKSVQRFERDQLRSVDGMIDAADIDLLRSLVEGDRGLPPLTPAPPAPLGPGELATVRSDGLAIAPAAAPQEVKDIIAAGNAIAFKPYRYGGGHGRWRDSGYDCSGSVSYALHGANLLDEALPSSGFMRWGQPGAGRWVSVYAHGGHAYMVVAGLRFDTSGRQQDKSRWHSSTRSTRGYTVRHPAGL